MNNWDFSVPADDFPEPMLLVSPDGEGIVNGMGVKQP